MHRSRAGGLDLVLRVLGLFVLGLIVTSASLSSH